MRSKQHGTTSRIETEGKPEGAVSQIEARNLKSRHPVPRRAVNSVPFRRFFFMDGVGLPLLSRGL
jgi:hypothetical protein